MIANNEEEMFRYKRMQIEHYGRGGVSISIEIEALWWYDLVDRRILCYKEIGDNAANGKKKARSVAGSTPVG